MKTKSGLLLITFLLIAFLCTQAMASDTPFLRIDRDDPEALKGELDNVRLLTGHLYA